MFADRQRFAISLMLLQQIIFSAEITLIHYLGQSLSMLQFGVLRGLGGIIVAVSFSLFVSTNWQILRTHQFPLQIVRGLIVILYGWVQVLSFGRLPLSDATAISFTQAIYIVVFSFVILGETQHWLPRSLAVVIGVAGAILIVKPSGFVVSTGFIYLIAIVGAGLNGLNFVLNKYSNRKDSAETTMVYGNLFQFSGNLLILSYMSIHESQFPSVHFSPWWFLALLFFGPIGMYSGIVAVKYADASALAPFTLVRLVIAVLAGMLLFYEFPDMWSSAGMIAICISCVLAVQRRHLVIFRVKSDDAQ